jgi:hypothetical protein
LELVKTLLLKDLLVAVGASELVFKPFIEALLVEHMITVDQYCHLLTLIKLGQANGALSVLFKEFMIPILIQ